LLQDFVGSYTDVPVVKYVQTAGSVDYKLNAYLPGRTSNWIKLQFDLSFLSTRTTVTSAEVHIFVSNVNLDTATLTKGVVDVYDGSRTLSRKGHTLPCVPPFCTTARKVGRRLLATTSAAAAAAAKFCQLLGLYVWSGQASETVSASTAWCAPVHYLH
jgi:hypothetical protein